MSVGASQLPAVRPPERRASRQVAVLLIARGMRGFGDGFATIILPAYLSSIGYGANGIGLIAAAALLGTALLTLGTGFIAAHCALRTLLFAGAGLMAFTGVALPQLENIGWIALIAFVGSINPSTGDLGILVPLEHTMLARNAADNERTSVFARYSLIGALSTAAGALAAGAPEALARFGLGTPEAFRIMFYIYAGLGLVSAALYSRLPHVRAHERTPAAPLGPSRANVYKLAALFSVDAFAGGFVVQSLLVLWLFQRFDLSLGAASVFFFWSNGLSALSYPVAARLARRFGLINTMVFTHIPSSIFLIGAALSPNLTLALALLLLRASLSQMDVPTRTSYVMAVVTAEERPAAASVTAVPRSLASAVSPALAGFLLTASFAGLPLILCGTLKIFYDLALLFSFRHLKPPEEQV